MYKLVIIFLLSIITLTLQAETWSTQDIAKIKTFSLDQLRNPVDASNKYSLNSQAIALGKSLFNDKNLSSNGKVSCSSCHIEEHEFTDNQKLAQGLKVGFRNTPTLLNAASQNWFFADGAKDSLWAQALSSIESPSEHNFTRVELVRLIASNDSYREEHSRIFNKSLPTKLQLESLPLAAGPNAKLDYLKAWKKLTKVQKNEINLVFTNIGKAIAAYVTTLKSDKTRFDDFISELSKRSTSNKLTASEQQGYRLFISPEVGCSNCHSGPLFSNKSFHDISTGIQGKDNGRSEIIESLVRDEFNCLGKYSDAKPEKCLELNFINRNKHSLSGAYKTSTLRGISKTAPYFHDGRFNTLEEVIKHYISVSKIQNKKNDLSPVSLSQKQQADLINFLSTL